MNIYEPLADQSTVPVSEFNAAVNASRFVKGFGIAVLVYSALLFTGVNLLSSAVGIGTGLFIFRYDTGRFYKALGLGVMALSLVSPLPFLSPSVLASSLIWKGAQLLGVLRRSPQTDPDWSPTRTRVVAGMIASSLGLLLCLAFIVLVALVAMLVASRELHSGQ